MTDETTESQEAQASIRACIDSAIQELGTQSYKITLACAYGLGEDALQKADAGELRRRLALVRTKLDEASLWLRSACELAESKQPMNGWP